jgi:Aspartyl/Asparaginyl beta-hydroxylase
MNNFRAVVHLDTFAVMPRLHKLQPANWKGVTERGEYNVPEIGMGASIILRGHDPITKENWLDDLPIKETQTLTEWATMKSLLAKARKAIMNEPIAKQYLSGEMGRAMVSRLDPGSTIFWHVDDGPYHEKNIRFHLPLVTNPGCLLYSGPESMHVPVGLLTYFNNRVRHSAANWGQFHRLHLIFEMRRLDKDDA